MFLHKVVEAGSHVAVTVESCAQIFIVHISLLWRASNPKKQSASSLLSIYATKARHYLAFHWAIVQSESAMQRSTKT